MFGEERGQGRPFPLPVSSTSVDRSGVRQLGVTIDVLPDYALLEIFDFYKGLATYLHSSAWKWQTLAHVCRRWRHIILASPRRLDLRVYCNSRKQTRKALNIWPSFPISLTSFFPFDGRMDVQSEENIIAALEQRDRIAEIVLDGLTRTMLERFAAVMGEPLPGLTYLDMASYDVPVAALPDAFLGGSAPRLRVIALRGIPFPALPNLVLSASRLHSLHLREIPRSGYIPPHAMVTVLLALPDLKFLTIEFRSAQSRPLQVIPPPFTRVVLPTLTNLQFKGISEYLEGFVSRIETPLLNSFQITLFSESLFDIPHLYKFIDRTESLKPLKKAEMKLSPWGILAVLGSPTAFPNVIKLEIAHSVLEWQVPSMARVCNQLLPLLSQVERLDIVEGSGGRVEWPDYPDPTPWLELLNPFVSVKSLYVSKKLGPLLEPALQELAGERLGVMEVLPALHDLFLEGPQSSGSVQDAIKSFVAARQFSDHPVVIQRWERMLESR